MKILKLSFYTKQTYQQILILLQNAFNVTIAGTLGKNDFFKGPRNRHRRSSETGIPGVCQRADGILYFKHRQEVKY